VVGLFGGSFDPIHHGHLIVARVVAEELGLEAVRFVPAREQPLKRREGGKAGRREEAHGATAEQRAAMVELAVAGESGFSMEPIEVSRPGPSYTVDTLRALREREPGLDPVLLLGMDAAAELPRWKESEAVLELAKVAVFSRGGSDEVSVPGIWRRVTVPALEISATEIRRRVAAGRPIRYWVPDSVAEYIENYGLYRQAD
jgi:nicotinate-nucleotide adenylyltransferase